MKRIGSILLLLVVLVLNSYGQENEKVLNDIDNQIWIPFVQSYKAYDYARFNALYSDRLTRVNSKEIRSAEVYKKKNKEWFIKAKEEGYQQSIEFAFDTRIVTGDKAFETGYYKVNIIQPEGESKNYYARFHVILEKGMGKWTITHDWDSSTINGEEITEMDFIKALENANTENTPITVMEYVKILNNHKAEATHYYKNNWEQLRKEAIKRDYISAYQLLQVEDNDTYDIILITEYGSQGQYDARETNFGILINESEGLNLLNDLEPATFRISVDSNVSRGL